MTQRIVTISNKKSKWENEQHAEQLAEYNHYLAIDWAEANMAVARLTKNMRIPIRHDQPTDLKEMKIYIDSLRGTKVLTVEETTTAHWLYLELSGHVDRMIICDPYRNRLLVDGPKTDKIDASKLCQLLRAGLLKEVFHSHSKDFELRKLVSSYQDLVKGGVRLKNQRSAIFRAQGKHGSDKFDSKTDQFILKQNETALEFYEKTKLEYMTKFERLCKTDKRIRNQTTITGIGIIGAVKIVATVVDAHRFEYAGKFLAYCGLVMLQKMSGNRSYGQRKPRYDRELKSVYKTASLSALVGDGPFHDYYESLREKGIADFNARNSVARLIAKISYGMLKNGTAYNPFLWKDRIRSAPKNREHNTCKEKELLTIAM